MIELMGGLDLGLLLWCLRWWMLLRSLLLHFFDVLSYPLLRLMRLHCLL